MNASRQNRFAIEPNRPFPARRRWCAILMFILFCSARNSFAPAISLEPDIRRDATVQVVESVMPSVVNIATAAIVQYRDPYDDRLRQFFGWDIRPPRTEEKYNVGSGIIVDEDGHILTCLHVLERARRAQVKLWDGRVYDVETNYFASPESDLALLKLRTKPGEKLKAVKFAADDDLLLGETVIALGNPFRLGISVSKGILSSKNRRPPVEDEALNVQDWLQTDVAINPGNSGGPLVNLRGELIGVSNAKGIGQGIGFAIPVKQVMAALSEFFSPESTDALWFGARIRPEGDVLRIDSVQSGSPADKAGLRAGQQIVQIDGNAANSFVRFNRGLATAKDHAVSLQVQKGSERFVTKVQLVPFDRLIKQKLGLVLQDLTAETAAIVNVQPGKALLIQDVEKDGPADRAQIRQGYLLTGIDGKSAESLMIVAGLLASKTNGMSVQLTVVVPRRLNNSSVEFRQGTVNLPVR